MLHLYFPWNHLFLFCFIFLIFWFPQVIRAGLVFVFVFFKDLQVLNHFLPSLTANHQSHKNTYTFVEENGSTLISQRPCVCACTAVRDWWALNDAAPLIKQTTHILHMCCWFDASDCGNGDYGADCYASLLLTQVNHSAGEAWLVLSGARGWMSNALLQMHYSRGALGWDVRIIKDRCVGLAQQTRHRYLKLPCPGETKHLKGMVQWKKTTLIICTPHIWGLRKGWELDCNHFWMFADSSPWCVMADSYYNCSSFQLWYYWNYSGIGIVKKGLFSFLKRQQISQDICLNVWITN